MWSGFLPSGRAAAADDALADTLVPGVLFHAPAVVSFEDELLSEREI